MGGTVAHFVQSFVDNLGPSYLFAFVDLGGEGGGGANMQLR